MSTADGSSASADKAQLEALGYQSELPRSIGLWNNFALGFTYLSPAVGAYSLFNFGLGTAGPVMVWWFAIAGVGQMLVCLVFGEVVSQYPIAGGVYPWARRLVGKRWAWMTGWVYAWALLVSIAAVASGAPPFVRELFGFAGNQVTLTITALLLVAVTIPINMLGSKVLGAVAMFGFLCEVIGAVAVGTYLLVFDRHQSLRVVVQPFTMPSGLSHWPAFLAAAIVGLSCCYGFEACGDVAEETKSPGIIIPRTMRMTIYVGISVAVYATVALTLAVRDMSATLANPSLDAVNAVLHQAFGPLATKMVVMVLLVSFVSCVLSLQAAASRLIYSYARDNMIVGSRFLARLSGTHRVPVIALLVSGVVPALIVCVGFFIKNALTVIFSFATAGIYLSFQMVVVGALYARYVGWRPNGEFKLGRWGVPVTGLSLIYGAASLAIILQPLPNGGAWYLRAATLLATTFVLALGLLYMAVGKPYRNNGAPIEGGLSPSAQHSL